MELILASFQPRIGVGLIHSILVSAWYIVMGHVGIGCAHWLIVLVFKLADSVVGTIRISHVVILDGCPLNMTRSTRLHWSLNTPTCHFSINPPSSIILQPFIHLDLITVSTAINIIISLNNMGT